MEYISLLFVKEFMSNSLEQYSDEILGVVEDKRERADHLNVVAQATRSVIYGGLVDRYLESAVAVSRGDQLESAVEPNKVDIASAVNFLSRAAVRTEAKYGERRPDVLNSSEFRNEIGRLQVNVAQGVIDLVSEQYGMIAQEGRDQVEFADGAFSLLRQRVQLLLAGLNYATFTGKTMLTGRALLGGSDGLDLSGWTERQTQQSMPHLVLSNTAIGQIVSALLQRGKEGDLFSIVDIGSGTGCTLAGSILGVRDSVENGFNEKRLSMTGIEGGRRFFNDELLPFVDIAVDKLADFSLSKTVCYRPETHELESGQFNLVYGEVLESLKQLRFSKEVQAGVVVITANYVWHRLPRAVKDAMIKEIAEKSPNSIFLVADLVQNASEVNRRYFNFRDNGLLNCGNVGLDDVFKFNGYRLIELNQSTAPKTMDARLAQQIGKGTTTDSIFYVAYRGSKAADLVENW